MEIACEFMYPIQKAVFNIFLIQSKRMLILIANGPLKITKDYKNVQKIKKKHKYYEPQNINLQVITGKLLLSKGVHLLPYYVD